MAAAAAAAVAGASVDAGALTTPQATRAATGPTPTSRLLHRDVLINADIWDRRPRMLAAGLGFTNIIGVPGPSTSDLAASEARVRAVGGTWNRVSCAAGETPPLSAYTSASTPSRWRWHTVIRPPRPMACRSSSAGRSTRARWIPAISR